MSKVKLEITEDNKKLISSFQLKTLDNGGVELDPTQPYGGGLLKDEVALILGYGGKHIKFSEYHHDGKKYEPEIEEHIIKTHNSLFIEGDDEGSYEWIMSLLIQFSVSGGLETGVYECLDNEKIWKKIN